MPLVPRRMGIDTQQEFVVYMDRECVVCRSEGFDAQTRVLVHNGGHRILATLNVTDPGLLSPGEAGLSNSAWLALGIRASDHVHVAHAPTLDSMSDVRAKIYGHRLSAPALDGIVQDIASGRYPDAHIAAFLAACAGGRMDRQETIDLTRASGHVPCCARTDARAAGTPGIAARSYTSGMPEFSRYARGT